MVKTIAVIPARGGSTRIPKKNIIDFMGKPMIAYTIEACQKSKMFDRILVSTDSEDIAKISLEYGADVPFLRDKYADNNTPVSEAVLYSAEQAEKYWNEKYDNVVMLMANCPIRDDNDIKNAYNNFIEKKYQSQLTCFKFGFMNPWWAMRLKDGKGFKIITDRDTYIRSQDLEDLYCPCGAIWISKIEHLRKYKSFYGEHNFYELNWKSAVDIDDYDDLELAKAVYLLKRDGVHNV